MVKMIPDKTGRFARRPLGPDFLQADGLKPMKEVPGAAVARHVTLTRPRDLGPGEIAALIRLPHRPARSIEEEVVMDRSTHIVTAPAPTAGGHSRCILALDLGSTLGWALRTRNDVILSGTRQFRPSRFEGGGMRYLRFTGWLDDVLEHAGGLDTVLFEEVRAHAGTDAAHIYGGFLASLSSWCEHRAIPYEGVPIGTIKRHVTGKGNANKAAMMQAVRALGHHPEDDNEADAIALLRWAIDTGGGMR